jgi:hypothetical protein
MRKISIILAIVLCWAVSLAAQQPQGKGQAKKEQAASEEQKAAHITFEETNHNFGTLKFKGEPVTVDFKFTNTGTAPLVIIRTEESCRCLKTKFKRQPVAPGESGVLSVTYSPDKYTGQFNNTITVFTNGTGQKEVLFVNGETLK